MRRRWIAILRIAHYGLRNFSRNAWLSTAATAVMVVTLTITLSTFTARMVADDTLEQVRKKIDISVYLKDNISPEDLKRLEGEIKKIPIVTSVEHISKDQAREIFKKEKKAEFDQLEALGELGETNPFPASLRVHISDTNKLDSINQVINRDDLRALQSDLASSSGPRKTAIETIARIASFAEIAGLAASGIFVTLSIMIIFNTIRMAIFNRRDEIEIMKLIGAEKSFIRGPFIVEASLYGVVAAVISVALMYVMLLFAGPALREYGIEVGATVAFFAAWPALIFVAQVLLGIFIGIISSLLAMRRYLKL